MSHTVTPNPDLDPNAIADAVANGNIGCLLPVLYQLTGEEQWLAAPYLPTRTKAFEENVDGGLPTEVANEIRAAATKAVIDWGNGKPVAHAQPQGAELTRLMSAVLGEPIPEDYAPMIAEQLGFAPYQPTDVSEKIRSERADFTVAIVGAGFSGLNCAINLEAAGIPYRVFERDENIGGTWWANRYPGARVDIPSDLYSFSFHPKNWSEYFARRDEIFEYITDVAETHGVTEHIALRHSVESAVWRDDEQVWVLTVVTPDGTSTEFRASALVTAAGLHSTPNIPDFPGADEFTGQVVHSAQWPEDLDLTGKRVAVVGSGASAMQLVVAIADQVESMAVVARQPQWVTPNEHYFHASDATKHWLYDNIPFYRGWNRFRLYWLYTERSFAALPVDPQRAEKGKLVSSLNDAYRAHFTAYLTHELGGDEDLIQRCLPDYPPFGKRLLIDNGWYRTLRQPNVELLTDRIDRLTPTGFVTTDGTERDIDVLILCTGFQQQRFLFPMEIRGREETSLRESWSDDNGRAYLGLTTPGFPNLFFLYGPNTNPPGGSYLAIAQAQVRYVVESIARLVTDDLSSLECRPEPYERYNVELDAANDTMVYAMDGVDSYYRNTSGRVVTNSPWPVHEYWARTAQPKAEDFVARARG